MNPKGNSATAGLPRVDYITQTRDRAVTSSGGRLQGNSRGEVCVVFPS